MNVNFLKKILHTLFNTRAAGIYILLFAFFIGLATFIENDFGTDSAQKVIFKSWWFELLLLLFAVCLTYNIIQFRMIKQKRWALLMFHASMIIILLGAGITRYFGFEGMMHIREGESTNSFLSRESFLNFEVRKGNQSYSFDEEVLLSSLGSNNFDREYLIDGHLIEVNLTEFIPNPVQEIIESEDGNAIIKIVFGGAQGREEYYLSSGDTRRYNGVLFNFNSFEMPDAINIDFTDQQITIASDRVLQQTVMATQERDTLYPEAGKHMLRLRSLYSDGANSFVFGDFNPSGKLLLKSDNLKIKNESLKAVGLQISVDGEPKQVMVYGRKGMAGRREVLAYNNLDLAVSYGSKKMTVPFEIGLYDFQLEKYPGTDNAASYASEVQLIDNRNNYKTDYRIFMNNILEYGGYRFFQSSFDRDELGTYLSVNYDFWGTWVSYLGYILLTLGLIFSFFSKKSRFYQVVSKLKSKTLLYAIITFGTLQFDSMDLHGQKTIDPNISIVSSSHAEIFSQIIVQDQKGRMKPIHTLTRELLRKISRKETFNGYNADQVILSMFANQQDWIGMPLIKGSKSPQIHNKLGTDKEMLAYKDFFETNGSYKLRDEVRAAFTMDAVDRTSYEKDLMKLDERLNIVSMIFSGRIFKIIPVPDHDNNLWVSNHTDGHGQDPISQPVAERFFPAYKQALFEALQTNDYSLCNQILFELDNYQKDKGSAVRPSDIRIGLEILLNKLNVFGRLSTYYLLLGMAFLVLLFLGVFKPKLDARKAFKILVLLVFAGFIFHTAGLGIRWYVSGRAPWSNGYESMIYIAFTSCLAGLIFTRKSIGGLAATMVLAGTILLVAKLSYLDPEITPLVPVLRSYWLTIHVSLIAGSYGFLMLGAIIGLINLILFMFLTDGNKVRIKSLVKEMSYISEITLIGGLVMISIGTYLGGVWANESWGRYWGWDAKETWALVTILVYAFILHMRLIPHLQGLYIYNVAKLFGWASVIMTYFGVNYYLSGLHSYAAGDPIPIPGWVYISVASATIIAVIAYWRYKKFNVDKL